MARNEMKAKLGINGSSSKGSSGWPNKSSGTRPADMKKTPYRWEDWAGTTKGKTVHTYKRGG